MAPLIVLVGPPGAGKSTVGRALAAALQRPFRDVDDDIEAVAGQSISDIFTGQGEDHFRGLERQAVAAALTEHDGVLALGGGAVLADSTRELLRGHRVAFLSVSMPVGVQRTGLASNRPLLAGVNPRADYRRLLQARLPLYQQVATVTVDTDSAGPDELAAELARWLASAAAPTAAGQAGDRVAGADRPPVDRPESEPSR